MAVLQLAPKSSLAALGDATEIALAGGTLDPEAIALILRRRDGGTLLPIDLTHHRGAPALHAQTVSLDAYRITALAEQAI